MLDPSHIDVTRIVVTILAALLVAWFFAMFASFALADLRRYLNARARARAYAYRRPTNRRRI